MPLAEAAGTMDPNGKPTKQAVDRLMGATFQRAYGDPELTRLYAQAQDPEARTILGGMAEAAGAMSRLHGAGDLDIRSDISEAAKVAVNARRQAVKLADFAKQADLDRSPNAQAAIDLFAQNGRSAKRIGEKLHEAATFAHDEFSKPAEDMFGPVERATKAQVLEKLGDTTRPKDLGLAERGKLVSNGVEPDAGQRSGPANDRPVETVGTAQRGISRADAATTTAPADSDQVKAPGAQRIKDAIAARRASKGEPLKAEAPAEESFLKAQTPDELRALDARQQEAQKAEADAKREAAQRADADAAAKDFKLTGSDRDADKAAAEGQEPLFSKGKSSGAMSGDDVRRAIAHDPVNKHADVYDTLDDAPKHVRDAIKERGGDDHEGYYDPKTNRVALIPAGVRVSHKSVFWACWGYPRLTRRV